MYFVCDLHTKAQVTILDSPQNWFKFLLADASLSRGL